MLDLKPFANAIAQLEESLAFSQSELAKKDQRLFLQFRSAGIQAFEYTYELAIKMFRRTIEHYHPDVVPGDADDWSFKEILRRAAEFGLLQDFDQWLGFRKLRNISSHSYDEVKATEVYTALPEFLAAVQDSFRAMKAKQT